MKVSLNSLSLASVLRQYFASVTYVKLDNLILMLWYKMAWCVFLPCGQCFQPRLQNHHDPDRDKMITGY